MALLKQSQARRKALTRADGPRPARSYKIAPTFSRGAQKAFHVGTCDKSVGETQVKRGKLRRKQTEVIPCGGRLIARLGKGSRRRVYCESCRERKRQAQKIQRLTRRATRLGFVTQAQEARESRRNFLSKLRRSGSR